MFAFIRADLISSKNGLAFFLLCLIFFGYTIYSFHFQRNMVHLGRRIFPLMRKNILDDGEVSNWRFIEELDPILRIFELLQILCALIQMACGIAATLELNYFRVFRIAFIVDGIFMICNTFFAVYQLFRIGKVTSRSTMNITLKHQILKRIHTQQVYFICLGVIATFVTFSLAFGLIPLRWEMLIFWILIEICVSSLMIVELIISFRKTLMKKSRVLTSRFKSRKRYTLSVQNVELATPSVKEGETNSQLYLDSATIRL